MYKGTIIESSLSNKDFLNKLKINKTQHSGSWTLYDVLIEDDQILELSKFLNDGPWYIHVWQSGNDNVKVIYKDKIFDIKFSDKSTWADAVNYGKSIGIPEAQLDFPID